MPKIHLDYSDGRYFTRPLTDEEAADREAKQLAEVEKEIRAEKTPLKGAI